MTAVKENPIDYFTEENNELVGKYQNDLLHNILACSIVDIQSAFENLIAKLQGLWQCGDIRHIEVVTLYNCAIISVQRHCHFTSLQSYHKLLENEIITFLRRDVVLLGLLSICSLCHLLAGELTAARNIIKTVEKYLSTLQRNVKENVCMERCKAMVIPVLGFFTGLAEQPFSQGHQEMRDSVHLVAALVHIKTCDCSAALTHLQSLKQNKYIYVKKYLTGYSNYQQGDYGASLSCLSSLDDDEMDKQEKADVSYLKSLCFAKQHKLELAIQQVRRCLAADFLHHATALYHLSQLYKTLNLPNAQLEALNLLLSAVKKLSCEEQQQQQPGPAKMRDVVMKSVIGQTITLNQAYYALASTCLANRRYEAAGKTYIEMIGNFMRTGLEHRDPVGHLIKMPDVSSVFREAAEAQILANRPQEALAVCNHLLDKSVSGLVSYDDSATNHRDTEEIHSSGEEVIKQKKRMRSEADTAVSHDVIDGQVTQLFMLKYKAEALFMMDEKDNAQESINRCVEVYQEYCDSLAHRLKPEDKAPPAKCQKVDTEMKSVKDEETDSRVEKLMADVFCLTANILSSKSNHTQALHWTRLACQIAPGYEKPRELHLTVQQHLAS